jgi:cytochrome o ubiquinol oxidase subunit IV
MSQLTHNAAHGSDGHQQAEHGSAKSYIIGFILSLIFTFIPYYIVVNKVISGDALLATILGIAVIQMIIQIVFFLHLGRERKPRWQLYFFIGTVGAILVVVGGSWFIMKHLHYNMAPADVSKKLVEKEGIYQLGGEKTGACRGGDYTLHQVTIRNGTVDPNRTEARFCDRLLIINEDDEVREITFGTHPQHESYAGESELVVRKGRAKTLILNEPGSYQFHDHLDSETAGYFTVKPAGQE